MAGIACPVFGGGGGWVGDTPVGDNPAATLRWPQREPKVAAYRPAHTSLPPCANEPAHTSLPLYTPVREGFVVFIGIIRCGWRQPLHPMNPVNPSGDCPSTYESYDSYESLPDIIPLCILRIF